MVTRLSVRDFRSYEAAEVGFAPGLTVVTGPNGAGKTNLLEALYFGCTGRSCRTSVDREAIRFGTRVCRLDLRTEGESGAHRLGVGFGVLVPGEPAVKRLSVDGLPVERLVAGEVRPLVSVFLPDRLELITGAPALRRAHVDQVVAAQWPGRAATRAAYGQALAQRNALLAGIKAGRAGRGSLPAWDAELARHGIELMAHRSELAEQLAHRFAALGALLGLEGELELRYRPRSPATTAQELVAELVERVESDLERGFTQHGPHRDDLVLKRAGRDLRSYGSRGQQRLGLLALLLAEREQLADVRHVVPLLLLDDVMSELDAHRRARLVELLRARGQAVITTTELEHVPGGDAPDVARLAIGDDGAILQEVPA